MFCLPHSSAIFHCNTYQTGGSDGVNRPVQSWWLDVVQVNDSEEAVYWDKTLIEDIEEGNY